MSAKATFKYGDSHAEPTTGASFVAKFVVEVGIAMETFDMCDYWTTGDVHGRKALFLGGRSEKYVITL